MPRYMIESCTDGVNWTTRDTCDEEQVDSALEALDLFDDCGAKYRVFDMQEQLIVAELPKSTDTIPRPAGCRCHWEAGDSECSVHPSEDEAA